MRADPVGEPLRPGRLGIGVAGGPECGDEQLGCHHLSGQAVDHLQGRAGIVDEQPLAGDMGLPHGRRQPRLPGAVEVAETTVAVAVGVRGAVLLPEQLQRHALPAQLAMDRPPIGLRPSRLDLGQRRRGRKQPRLQRRIGNALGQRPGDVGRPRPLQKIDNRRRLDRQAQRDIAARHAGRRQPQHVAYLAHG